MIDNYLHVESGLFYIVENIMGPVEQSLAYEQLLDNFNSQIADCCDCDTICSAATCKCLKISHGENYHIAGDRKYKLNYEKRSYPILECNDKCSCSDDCGNRVVQKGPIDSLKIRTCDEKSKGLGLYSTSYINKGTFICEYAGELITKSQACERQELNKLDGKMNYIFCLNELSGGHTVQTFVDPSNFGNIGRYINHSCDPNCEIRPVRCQSPIPKLAIFSCKNILPGKEITFCYGPNVTKSVDNSRTKCLCYSANCSGFMPYDVY